MIITVYSGVPPCSTTDASNQLLKQCYMNSYNRYLHARIAADINLLKLQLFQLVAYSTSTFGPMAALSGSSAVQPHIWQTLIHNLTNLGISTSQLMHTPMYILSIPLPGEKCTLCCACSFRNESECSVKTMNSLTTQT